MKSQVHLPQIRTLRSHYTGGVPSLPPLGRTPDVSPSSLTQDFDFGRLRSWPMEESGQGYDAADLLLLDTAAAWFRAGHSREDLVVLDDRWGALTLPLLAQSMTDSEEGTCSAVDEALAHTRSAQDGIVSEKALQANAVALGLPAPVPETIDARLFTGARTVVMPLPRSREALEDWAWLIAENAADDVVLLAGGRDKHMSRSMNEVLNRHFDDVVPGRGRSKARVLTARGPKRGLSSTMPRRAEYDVGLDASLQLRSLGATYGGAKFDPGTRFLLQTLEGQPAFPGAARAVDLGCGNGSVNAYLARRYPNLRFLAADQSASAVRSTELTAEANGVQDRVETFRDDALSSLPDSSEDLILLNPPFHQGNAVDVSVAHRLIDDAARVLRPGGRLYTVWNSHLKYHPRLERTVGPTARLAKNSTFTITESTRRGAG